MDGACGLAQPNANRRALELGAVVGHGVQCGNTSCASSVCSMA
jgi:hypothetical protein